jgi:ribose 5-phosphate isomerase B
MKIFIAADHAGFELKNVLLPYIQELGHEVEDCGAYEFNPEDDYPRFVSKAANAVSNDSEFSRAIIIGGSGQGEAMVANRFPRVRSAIFYGGSEDIITLSREHNNANALSLGARFLNEEEARDAVKKWLETTFPGEERHKRRIAQIDHARN